MSWEKGRFLQKKGLDAEKIAIRACKELVGEKKINSFEPMGNAPGRDIKIIGIDGRVIPLEIKSSWHNVDKHNFFYNTPCLVIPLKKTSPNGSQIRKGVKRTKPKIMEIIEKNKNQ